MNGTSGFQAVQSSTSRSSCQFLHEQRHRIRAGAWHLLHTHDLIAISTGISTKREKVPEAFLMPPSKELPRMALWLGFKIRVFLSSDDRTTSSIGNVQRENVPGTVSESQKRSPSVFTLAIRSDLFKRNILASIKKSAEPSGVVSESEIEE